MNRRCRQCKKIKTKVYNDTCCSDCHNKYQKEWRRINSKKVIKWQRNWRKNNPEKIKEYAKKYISTPNERKKNLTRNKIYRNETKLKVLRYYSNNKFECKCCGEKEIKFLSIDHINNDGAKHRKQKGVAGNIYRWLLKNNYPKGFQVLCFNCNMAKGFYKICPHKTKLKELKNKL